MAPAVLTTVKIPAVAQFGAGQYDLCALADVKTEMQIGPITDDAWIASLISRASQAVAQFCNRIFQVQTYEDRFWPQLDPYPWQLPGGVMPLQLTNWPLAAQVSPSATTPPPAPILSAVPGGALAATVYYAKITYVTLEGETAASLETRLPVAANNLLAVATPPPDGYGIATGWNVYLGTASFGETLQNSSPLALGAAFTLPAPGLVSGAALPSYVTAVENVQQPVSPVSAPNNIPPATPPVPTQLAEGVDFLADSTNGQLSRLRFDGYVRRWYAQPTVVQYPAGFSTIPADLQEAVIRLVKSRWFARQRDPMLRSENIEGVYSANYFYGTGPGAPADMPADIAAMLDRNYRTPVIA